MAINLDEINTLSVKKIMPGVVDSFFKNDPLLAFLKKNRYKVWTGGPQIQENFLFKPLKGGSYRKGAQFDITKLQTKTGLLFEPKFYEVNVTEYTEDIEVIIRGPEAVMSLVQADLANAALTMSGILACALYRHGQGASGNQGGANQGSGVNFTEDRSAELNGMEEALSDGVNNTYSGQTFPSYGTQSRTDVFPALTPPGTQTGSLIPANVGSTSATAGINYRVLEHSYQSCVIGDEHPVVGVTTNRCMGFINENFQPQQRIDTIEPTIGFPGIKFKQSTIVESQYCPGQDITSADVQLGAFQLGTTLSLSTATKGETFWWLNPGKEGDDAYINLYFSASPKYQFGFTGFKVAQDSTMVAGQILFGGNVTFRALRLMRGLFGILN